MSSKQQGDEIGIASEGQGNLDDHDPQLTPDMSNLNISGSTQGASGETPKIPPKPVARKIFDPAEVEMEKLNVEISKLDELLREVKEDGSITSSERVILDRDIRLKRRNLRSALGKLLTDKSTKEYQQTHNVLLAAKKSSIQNSSKRT